MPNYANSVSRVLNEKVGEAPSVLDFGAKGDLSFASDGVATATDATFTSASASFTSADIGKRIVLFGAGAATGNLTQLRAGANVVATTATAASVEATELDCRAAKELVVCVASATYGTAFQVFGADASDFSDEASVYGPTTVAAQAWAYHTITDPAKRYYRVKVVDAVSGEHATAYVTAVAYGYAHGATIASINSATSVELSAAPTSTASGLTYCYGTDDTAAIQAGLNSVLARLNISGGDGGGSLFVPPGQYLISDTLIVPKKIELRGASMSASAIFADPAAWTDTNYMVQLGPITGDSDLGPAIATRLVDLRLNGNHSLCSGVYAENVQESSGILRCSIVNWRYKGIRFYFYGCQHWTLEQLWIFPSNTALNDADVMGIDLEQTISSNPINQATVYAQGGYGAGKGTAINVNNCNCQMYDIHTENALKGVHFNTGSVGVLINNTGHPMVESSVYITTVNDVTVMNSSSNGSKYNIYDAVSATGITDGRLGAYFGNPNPTRFRGPNNSTARIVEWIPGAASSGKPPSYIDGRGNLAIDGGTPENPNVITHCGVNYGGATQGGFVAVNSRAAAYPNWEQTSTNEEDQAMFVRLGAQMFQVRFGDAENTQGADPGAASLTVTPDEVKLIRLYFSYAEPLAFGNALGLHRMRIWHGDTDQSQMVLERSQDSGLNWDSLLTLLLDQDIVRVTGKFQWNNGNHTLYGGVGSPESVISVGAGSLYVSTTGDIYRKTGSGNTGWKLVGGAGKVEFTDVTVYDPTATTGVTELIARAGAGQGTSKVLAVQDNDTNVKFGVTKDGDVACRKVDATGAITAQNHATGNVMLLKASGGTELFAVDNSGYAYILNGLTIGSIGANKVVITNGDSLTVGVSGATGSFTTADSKTVTVTGGVVTSIV